VKNILHGMKLGAFMIDTGFDKDKPESLRKGWTLVRKNINRVSKMTKEMLSLASTAPPAFEVCSLNEIVEEVCELLAEEISRREISLVLELDPSLPQVTVDPDGIHTCLLNLVTNAIEAFPEDTSGGQVTVSSRDEGEAGVHLQVRDSGEGMSEELLERVLENLFTTKGARGTGLGLAITQKIVHEHGGTIQVESEPKKGSCFTIILPE
jgi:signal transduction histidine kinase